MALLNDEFTAEVVEIHPWGLMLSTGGGERAFLDNTKTLKWKGLGESLEVGDTVHVVVVDDERDPCRVSALPEDFEIAKTLRRG